MTVEELAADPRVHAEATRRLRRTFRWLPAEKDREGEPNREQLVSVTSEKDADRRLLWMLVENEGELQSDAAVTAEAMMALRIGGYVQRLGGEATTRDIAKAIGVPAQDSTYKRALGEAVKVEYVVKSGHGKYAPGEEEVPLDE